MLKNTKLGTMVMALLVILVFTMATLNVGADKVPDKKTSDLKWVKKHVKGFGDVTAREDMFVGEGDNITLVLNKDYEEIGVITPIIENATEPDTVTVDTPYGKVVTPRDNYNKLGKDRIIADQKAFIEERNRLIKDGIINTSDESSGVIKVIPQTQTSYLSMPQATGTVTAESESWSREDYRFGVTPGFYPEGIYGQAVPAATSLPPSSVKAMYDELELHLERSGDVCEIISQHSSEGRSVWVALFIGGTPIGNMPAFWNTVNGAIEYYFRYIPANNWYEIRLYYPTTGETRYTTVTSTYMSHFIEHQSASVEFLHPNPVPSCYAYSTISQWRVYQGSNVYNPQLVFYPQYKTSAQYAEIGYYTSNFQYTTTHASGNTVP